jgi:sugar lactone lactonase YvrE
MAENLAIFDFDLDASDTAEIASLDTGISGFFSHRDPAIVKWSGADGLAINAGGRVYAATSAGVQVFSPQGRHLGTIPLSRSPQNLAFSGPARRRSTLSVATPHGKCSCWCQDTKAARSRKRT